MAVGQNLAPLSQPCISAAVQAIDPVALIQSGGLGFRLNALDNTGVKVEAEWRLDALVPVHADLPQVQDAREPISQARQQIDRQQRSQHIRRQLSLGRPSLLLHGSGHHSTVAGAVAARLCTDETIYLGMVRAYLGYALCRDTSESSSPLSLLVS